MPNEALSPPRRPPEAAMTARGVAVAAIVACVLSGSALGAGPTVGGCPVFPGDNIWNTPVDALPVHPRSDDYVASIGADLPLKADFAAGLYEGAPIGIPYVVVPKDQAMVAIHFAPFGDETEAFPDESDAGPYPVPADAPIEGGPDSSDDRHVLVVQEQSCTLYELYKAAPNADGSWNAVGSARFDLESNELRPEGWTSADAAGLPVFPGLARYEEVAAGEINHALRFTAPRTGRAYAWPARHFASPSDDSALPPMGQRFRLKATVDIGRFSAETQVLLRALQTYGMILADNGSAWFVSGAPDEAWDDEALNAEFRQLAGSDFEAVDVSPLKREIDSGEAAAP
jgi:hypothetical protein